MKKTIKAHFDGKVIVPDEPVNLPIGKRLRIQIKVTADENGNDATNGKKRSKTLKIIGTGKYHSGIRDLSTNKKHMEGFGKS